MLIIIYLFTLLSLTSCSHRDPNLDVVIDSFAHYVVGHPQPKSSARFWIETTTVKCEKRNLETHLLRLKTSGFQPGAKFSLYCGNTKFEVMKLFDLVANEQGELASDDGLLSQKQIPQFDYAQGEVMYFIICQKDGELCLVTSSCPKPLNYIWSDNATVKLIMYKQSCNDFLLVGTGFQTEEDVSLELVVDGSTMLLGKTRISPLGTILKPLSIEFDVPNGGKGTLLLNRPNHETGCIEFLWGEALLNDSIGEKTK